MYTVTDRITTHDYVDLTNKSGDRFVAILGHDVHDVLRKGEIYLIFPQFFTYSTTL